jgi:6-pyruvoyltetrahydropterin/6-carboxytetrahydropterin synthase
MKAYFSRRYRISASHRLHTEAYSDEQNRAVYGKCNHPHGHGHNYNIEVTVGGQVDAQTGMVCDLVLLDASVKNLVIDRFDHANLNLDPGFRELVPTTENLTILIFDLLKPAITAAELVKVKIEETSNNYFEYSGAS